MYGFDLDAAGRRRSRRGGTTANVTTDCATPYTTRCTASAGQPRERRRRGNVWDVLLGGPVHGRVAAHHDRAGVRQHEQPLLARVLLVVLVQVVAGERRRGGR